MNKKEFLKQLEEALLRLNKSDRDDIMLDYEEHFRVGLEKGMSEEDVAESLGSPADIAAQYLENLPENAKGQRVEPESTDNTPTVTVDEGKSAAETAGTDAGFGRKAANVLFWIAAIALIVFIIYLLIVVLGTVIGCFAGAAVLSCISVFAAGYTSIFLGLLLLSLGFICLAVLLIIGIIYSIKGIKLLIRVLKNTSRKILGRA